MVLLLDLYTQVLLKNKEEQRNFHWEMEAWPGMFKSSSFDLKIWITKVKIAKEPKQVTFITTVFVVMEENMD